MARPKQIPSTIGYWALLAPEMKQFCLAWIRQPTAPPWLHRFVKVRKEVSAWGGSKIPSQDSLDSLISVVVRKYDPVYTSPIPFISEQAFALPAQRGLVRPHTESRQGKIVADSVFYARTGCDTGLKQLVQTLPEGVVRVDDLVFVQQEYPDFTSAWLDYARQLLRNRSDATLVTRVWLHTHEWTQDPDRPDKLRRWTDASFAIKEIVRCIKRDTDMQVSIRTVSDVISRMCKEEPDLPRDASGGRLMMN